MQDTDINIRNMNRKSCKSVIVKMICSFWRFSGGEKYGKSSSVLLSLSVLSHVLGAVDKTNSSFSAHGKIGKSIIIIFCCSFSMDHSIVIFNVNIVIAYDRSSLNVKVVCIRV